MDIPPARQACSAMSHSSTSRKDPPFNPRNAVNMTTCDHLLHSWYHVVSMNGACCARKVSNKSHRNCRRQSEKAMWPWPKKQTYLKEPTKSAPAPSIGVVDNGLSLIFAKSSAGSLLQSAFLHKGLPRQKGLDCALLRHRLFTSRSQQGVMNPSSFQRLGLLIQ